LQAGYNRGEHPAWTKGPEKQNKGCSGLVFEMEPRRPRQKRREPVALNEREKLRQTERKEQGNQTKITDDIYRGGGGGGGGG